MQNDGLFLPRRLEDERHAVYDARCARAWLHLRAEEADLELRDEVLRLMPEALRAAR